MGAARMVLWRHGETDWNAEGRYQGQADVPLNARGLGQAASAAPRIAGLAPDRIVSSDLGRAVVTARTLGSVTGLPVEVDPSLQEINVGSWVGLTNEQIFAAHPQFKVDLYAGRDSRRSDTGETGAECAARISGALRRIAETAGDGETVVAVGHGFGLRVAIVELLGLGFAHHLSLGGLWNASWSILQPGPGAWRLLSYNNAC